MWFPLREINVSGMLVDPAAVLIVICGILWCLLRMALNHSIDMNRFVWGRPVVDLAIFVILYSVAILTLRPV